MLPNEVNYYIFFTIILLSLLMLKSLRIQTIILLAASYLIYILSNNYFVFSLLFVTILTFYCGKHINKRPNNKFYLAMSIIGSLGQLVLFKYTGLLNPLDITISALGISYFTFMALSYAIDIYHGKLQPTDSLLEYSLFLSFFPIITSGPIIRANNFLTQLKSGIVINSGNFQQGFTLITIGLIMKTVIADNLASYVDSIFSKPTQFGSHEIILATIAFGVQLYCDFGGYSNIALGSARMLGFKFPMNFNNPYFATSPQDFWHRWNISLSFWLRDYLYIPLGGNRKGTFRTYINLIITMILCGLWHGATWNFLIWGSYHGILLSLNKLIHPPSNRFSPIAGTLLTQYLIFMGWLIFRLNNVNDLKYCIGKFFHPTGFNYIEVILGVLVISLLLLVRGKVANNDWLNCLGSTRPVYWAVYLLIAFMIIYWLSPVRVTKFIYAGF